MKLIKIVFIWIPLAILAILAAANGWIVYSTRVQIKTKLDSTPSAAVGIVLGTSKTTKDGKPNLFFRVRIAAAAKLYHAGKVKRLLLSGDNSKADYNEPEDMRKALVAKGVPDSVMTCDYAGLRTLDTVARAREVFGLKDCTMITDDFHLPRAIFLANYYNLKANGYEAKPLPWKTSVSTRIREYFARVKLLLDLYVLKTKPKFGPV